MRRGLTGLVKLVLVVVLVMCSCLWGYSGEAAPLSAPNLSSPSDYYVKYNSTPHAFSWTSVSGASSYSLMVDTGTGFSTPDLTCNSASTSCKSYTTLPNGLYYWTVQAKDSSGTGGYWATPYRSFVVDTPPPAPTISGPANGTSYQQGTAIPFSWSGPSGYTINRYYLRVVAGTDLNATPVYQKEFNGTSDSVSTSGWTAGTYTWGIRAVKSAPSGYNQLTYESAIGWGGYATGSISIYAAPLPAPSYSTPSDYYVKYNSTPHTFSWTSVSGASSYSLMVDTGTGFSTPDLTCTTTSTSCASNTSLSNGVYYWTVQAKDSVGTGGYWASPYRSFVVDTPPPGPTISAPSNGTSYQQGAAIPFSWSGTSGYTINRYYLRVVAGTDLNATPVYQKEFNGTSDSVSTSGWAAGTYTWGIRAIKTAPAGYNQSTYESAIGWGTYSTRTITISVPLSAPSLVSPSDYQILRNTAPYNFDWSDVAGASGYRIYVDNNSGFGNPEINTTTTASSLSWNTGIIDGVYYWQVQAKDSAGTWYAWSTPVRQLILDTPPPAPTIGGPANGTSYQQSAAIAFSWSGPSGYTINRYYLRVVAGTDLNATPVYQKEFNGTSDSVSTSGWAAGTYTWGIRAIKTAPPGYNQTTYETAIGWGGYATRTITINEPLPDLTLSVGGITTNALQGSSVQVNCTVNRSGGGLPDPGTYVRVYLYVNQSISLTGAQLLCGDTCAFDFSKTSLADGTETLSKDITIPTDIKGPYYVIAVADGPNFWSESDKTNNLAASSSPVAIWQAGTPPSDEAMGVLARTWDNPDAYWIKYGKKWPFLDQATFYGLGYSDIEIGWYSSTALDGFPLGKTILNDNDNFVYRKQSNPTVYFIRDGKSDWFFNWDAFVNSQFGSNDVYWAKDVGATWIQLIYSLGQLIGQQPRIRIEPSKLFLVN